MYLYPIMYTDDLYVDKSLRGLTTFVDNVTDSLEKYGSILILFYANYLR